MLVVRPAKATPAAMAAAIRRIGSTPTAILGALEPVTALFFGVAVFGEALTLRIAAGVALILVAVSLVVAGGPLSRRLHLPLRLHRAK